MQDFVLMDPDGEREGAANKLFHWKRNKMPNMLQKVKSGFLCDLRRLQTEYCPTQVVNELTNVNNVETSNMEIDKDLRVMIQNLISPIKSPKRNVQLNQNIKLKLEDISEEELDFLDDYEVKEKSSNTGKQTLNNISDMSSSESSESDSSDSESSDSSSSNTVSSVRSKIINVNEKEIKEREHGLNLVEEKVPILTLKVKVVFL